MDGDHLHAGTRARHDRVDAVLDDFFALAKRRAESVGWRYVDLWSVLERNSAFRAGHDGIRVDSAAAQLTGNAAFFNHDLGIEAVTGVTDGGGNRAYGNGNPAQCTGVACG